MPSVKHDSEVQWERSVQYLTVLRSSVGVLLLHMIEEETVGEDGDHAEETPNSPPCTGQHLSTEQYGTTRLKKEFNRSFLNYQHVAE